MRTYKQLMQEIAFRRANGLPRIELTAEERAAQFGDATLAQQKRDQPHDAYLAERLKAGLYLSAEDKRRARRYMAGN
jgi:hypothetical protein